MKKFCKYFACLIIPIVMFGCLYMTGTVTAKADTSNEPATTAEPAISAEPAPTAESPAPTAESKDPATETPSTTQIPEYGNEKVLNGADATYNKNSSSGYTIRMDGKIEDFTNLMFDGKLVDKNEYKVTEGSTIINLSMNFMDNQSVGEHTVTAVFEDYTISTKVTIAENGKVAEETPNNTPKTSDNTPVAVLLTLAVLSGASALLLANKRRITK